jgi:hypothetical protein
VKIEAANLRIRWVPMRLSTCQVCGHITDCCYYDHDLRGDVCLHDSAHVIAAELSLRHTPGIEPNTDSILEGGL